MMRIGAYGQAAGQLRFPYHAATAAGECYVSDTANHRIIVFDVDGEYLRCWGSMGDGAGQLRRPRGIVVRDDFVFVADCDNHRVSIFNCDGNWQGFIGYGSDMQSFGGYEEEAPRMTIAAASNGPERRPLLSFPHALGLLGDRLYIASMGSNEVVVFALSGELVTRFGGAADVNSVLEAFFDRTPLPCAQLSWPKGICCHHNIVFVADTGNHRIVAFTPDGDFLREWGRKGVEPREFLGPTGVDAFEGYVYVSEHIGRRIQVFTLDGGYVKEKRLPNSGDLLGLSVDETHMYVVDEDEHCVWRVARTGRPPSPSAVRRNSLGDQGRYGESPTRRDTWAATGGSHGRSPPFTSSAGL